MYAFQSDFQDTSQIHMMGNCVCDFPFMETGKQQKCSEHIWYKDVRLDA